MDPAALPIWGTVRRVICFDADERKGLILFIVVVLSFKVEGDQDKIDNAVLSNEGPSTSLGLSMKRNQGKLITSVLKKDRSIRFISCLSALCFQAGAPVCKVL